MAGNEPDTAEDIDDDEEDWMKYANAGFGETDYSLWDDVEPVEEDEAHQQEVAMQLGTHVEEIPRAPRPAGLKHLVRQGTCDACLGRVGGKRTYGQSLEEAGQGIRASVVEQDSHLANVREDEPLCPFCENLFEEVDLLADIIFDAIEPYDISRLQLGARFPKDQMEEEEKLRKRLGAGGSDPLKSSLVEEIGKRLKDRLDGITMVNDKPDVLALIDVLTLTVELDVRAVYVYGRYRKLERGIPQTRWPCRACKGRGCERCNHTGLQYEKSVQDLVGNPMLEIFQGTEHAFHGMGREDIDVRCLGRGRPFVLEIKEPRSAVSTPKSWPTSSTKRPKARWRSRPFALRLAAKSSASRTRRLRNPTPFASRIEPMNEAEYAVLTAPVDMTKEDVQNRSKKRRRQRRGDKGADRTKPLETTIEVPAAGPSEKELKAMKKPELVALAETHGLAKTGKKDELIERILAALPPAPAVFDLPDDETILKIVEGLNGIKLAQRTPERVPHRRSDLIRKRTVFEAHSPFIEVNEDGQREIEFTLRCESGTYVKETIHGDSGRTQPSVAALIKAKCNVVWLDVGDIHAD